MKNSPLPQGIHPQIVSAACSIARKIVRDLRLPQDELEDMVQELIIGGIKAEGRYREGGITFSAYIFGRIRWLGLDIMRRYNSNRKVAYFRKVDLSHEERGITHAMVIHSRSREKVADVFSRYRLPTDVALSLANGRDELQVSVCSHNLFCQKNSVCKPRQCRIACLLPSYKRFKDLQRQIWCLMDQDTADFHLFVAVKGMAEADFQRLLLPQFSHFVEEGRLTLRLFPNRNQLSNLPDCVRRLDVSGFDLFAKLDDDDVYALDYLSLVQRFHSMLPKAVGSFYTGCGGYLRSSWGFPVINRGDFPCFGPTMVFPQEVLRLLLLFERNPQQAASLFPAADQPFLRSCLGLHEDSLLHFFNSRCFACNRTAFIDVRQRGLSLLVCQDNPSVMRGGCLSGDQCRRMHSTSPSKDNNERLFLFRHPGWCAYVRLLSTRAVNLANGDGADVLRQDETSLDLQWDRWGMERFCRDASGVFVLED